MPASAAVCLKITVHAATATPRDANSARQPTSATAATPSDGRIGVEVEAEEHHGDAEQHECEDRRAQQVVERAGEDDQRGAGR